MVTFFVRTHHFLFWFLVERDEFKIINLTRYRFPQENLSARKVL